MCAPYVEARPEGGARAEKEIGEKAQKIIRYQIVSTYFLHGAFKVFFFCEDVFQSFFGLKRVRTWMPLNAQDRDILYVMRDFSRKRVGRRGSWHFVIVFLAANYFSSRTITMSWGG